MPSVQNLVDILWPPDLPPRMGVWAIVDSARDERIYGAVDNCRRDKCCLYAGDLPWQLKMTAPYLVALDPASHFTQFLLRHGWGNAWGVILRTEAGMQTLRKHLRGFLRVRDEAGRKLIFRYYDPRILRVYLPTCWPAELSTVFGPVERFLLESDDPEILLDLSSENGGLVERRVRLANSRAGGAP